MFYTNRRANVTDAPGVSWVHGTPIGIAESSDGGHVEIPEHSGDYLRRQGLHLLARLRGFEGRNRLGGVKNGFESQKSALQSRLRLTRCDGDPGRRLGRQLQLQSLQEQFQIRLRLRISA